MSNFDKWITSGTFAAVIIGFTTMDYICYSFNKSRIDTLEYKLNRVETQYQVLLNKIKK